MQKKMIIINLPVKTKDSLIVRINQDEGVIICESVEEHEEDYRHEKPMAYFYYHDHLKTRFNPYDYAYIEITSNHYARLVPKDESMPVIDICVTSMASLLEQLERGGVHDFIRVHNSFAVNWREVRNYGDDFITVNCRRGKIPISKNYKDVINEHICLITYNL